MSTSLLKERERRVRTKGSLVLAGALATVAAIALTTYPGDRPTIEIIERPAMAASAETRNDWPAAHDGPKRIAWDLHCRPTSVLEAYATTWRVAGPCDHP